MPMFIDISVCNTIAHDSEARIQRAVQAVTKRLILPLIDTVVSRNIEAVKAYQPDEQKARALARKWALYALLDFVALAADCEIAVIDECQQVIVTD